MDLSDGHVFVPEQPSIDYKKYVIPVLVGVVVANALILDFLLATGRIGKSTTQQVVQYLPQNLACPQNCLFQIQQATASSTAVSSINSGTSSAQPAVPTAAPQATPTPLPTPTPQTLVKEYYIPLGSGSGNPTDWTTLPGIGATIDLGQYGEIDKAYFEVTVRIPTGNQTAYIRLHNATNYQTVPNSEVTLSGGTTTILTSSPISLTSGKNAYVVQLKTQLGYTTNIDQARIRIVTK